MSIHKIPDRYLNTTIDIFRDTGTIDSVGDQALTRETAYYSVKANIQSKKSEVEYNLQGRINYQTHIAYINRIESDATRQIKPGDIVLDEETGEYYIVLGIEVLQAGNRTITDSHHIKLILKNTTGYFDVAKFKTLTAKAQIT